MTWSIWTGPWARGRRRRRTPSSSLGRRHPGKSLQSLDQQFEPARGQQEGAADPALDAALVRIAGFDDVDLIVIDEGLSEESASAYPVQIRRVRPEPSLLPPPTVLMPEEAPRTALEPALVPTGERVAGNPAAATK